MALNATIYRFDLQISDLNRHYYQSHVLRVAQHPSENASRMLIRLIAFAIYAEERLEFTSGLCAEEEPELWVKNDIGGIDLWIDLGIPDLKRVKKASTQSKKVVVFSYGEQRVDTWWKKSQKDFANFSNLSVLKIDDDKLGGLVDALSRSPELHAVIEEGQIMLTLGDVVVDLPIEYLK